MLNIFVFFVFCVICNMKKYRETENIVSLVQPVHHQQWPHLRHMTEQLKLGHISSCHTNFPLRCQLMILKGKWMNHWERIHLNKGNGPASSNWSHTMSEKNVGGRKNTSSFQITTAFLHCRTQNATLQFYTRFHIRSMLGNVKLHINPVNQQCQII